MGPSMDITLACRVYRGPCCDSVYKGHGTGDPNFGPMLRTLDELSTLRPARA